MSYHRVQTEAWLKSIDVKADRVLDVGGAQNPIKGRTKSWEVKEYKILDLEKPHECNIKPDIIADIESYTLFNDIQFGSAEKDNFRKDCQTDYESYENYFDFIFCIEVSEYWLNPTEAIQNLFRLLNFNGILYITFPFVYGCHNPHGLDYLRYTPFGVEKLLKEAGFEILEHKHRYAHTEHLTLFYEYDNMKILKGNFNHDVIGSMVKAKKM
jgi:SAM-dependent methyltransferase